ncbi:MAG: hypothetical protein HKN68_19795 [Saprospiraceae bacterium]|nr:hypothetical protein [Saprospiraceae bacterium]
MKAVLKILTILTLLFYISCGKDEPEKLDLNKFRIKTVKVITPGSQDTSIYNYDYNSKGQLIRLDLPGVYLEYDDDRLVNYSTNQSRKFHLQYESDQVISILMEYLTSEGFPENLPVPAYEAYYDYESDFDFTRYDSTVTYNYTPDPPEPITRVRYVQSTINSQTSQTTSYTIEGVWHEGDVFVTDLSYDVNVENPFRKWNLPVAFNEFLLNPFRKSFAHLPADEIFFKTEYLPDLIEEKKNGAIILQRKCIYKVENGLLRKITSENSGPDASVSVYETFIEWEEI